MIIPDVNVLVHAPDAYLAATALAHGAQPATADRGFARYPRLRHFDPCAS